MKAIIRPKLLQEYPESAQIAYSGKVFEVLKWEQKLYDGTFKTFEMLKRPDTAVVIPVTEDGKILLVKQQQPGKKVLVDLPGGRVEKSETILDGAKRELFEETGYSSGDWVLLDAIQPLAKIDWFVFLIVARNCKKLEKAELDGGEKISIMKTSFEKFLDLSATGKITEQTELMNIVLRAKLFPKEMAKLRRKILGEVGLA